MKKWHKLSICSDATRKLFDEEHKRVVSRQRYENKLAMQENRKPLPILDDFYKSLERLVG